MQQRIKQFIHGTTIVPRPLLASALALTTLITACGGGEPEDADLRPGRSRTAHLSREDTTLEVKQDDRITINLKSDED